MGDERDYAGDEVEGKLLEEVRESKKDRLHG